jgi:hypothetical protein
MHFIEIYAARINSIQPYLGFPESTVDIQNILKIEAVDVGILLIIIIITYGAMLTDHHESHVFAHGLIEVCMVALNHVLESRCISQPIVGGIALRLLTLCVRSGKASFISVCIICNLPSREANKNQYAMSKRGQYLSVSHHYLAEGMNVMLTYRLAVEKQWDIKSRARVQQPWLTW